MMNQVPVIPRTPKPFATSLMISSGMVVPFFVLESINRPTVFKDFPILLFVFMSVHSLLIVLLLTPVLRRLQSERTLRGLKIGNWAGLVLCGVLVFAYVGVVMDQFPCFLGVPNCD